MAGIDDIAKILDDNKYVVSLFIPLDMSKDSGYFLRCHSENKTFDITLKEVKTNGKHL